jgi:hypothetical protein
MWRGLGARRSPLRQVELVLSVVGRDEDLAMRRLAGRADGLLIPRTVFGVRGALERGVGVLGGRNRRGILRRRDNVSHSKYRRQHSGTDSSDNNVLHSLTRVGCMAASSVGDAVTAASPLERDALIPSSVVRMRWSARRSSPARCGPALVARKRRVSGSTEGRERTRGGVRGSSWPGILLAGLRSTRAGMPPIHPRYCPAVRASDVRASAQARRRHAAERGKSCGISRWPKLLGDGTRIYPRPWRTMRLSQLVGRCY